MNCLPVNYYAQKSAWMTQQIFTEWFKTVFVPHVQRDLKSKNLPPKAILVLDNAPAHPDNNLQSDDGNITCYFLPPNTTPLIQPMDQSVIETLKRRYRKKFIQRSWNKLWPESTGLLSSETKELVEFEIEILNTTSSTLDLEMSDITEWLDCDGTDAGYQLMTDDQIVDLVNEDESVDSENDDAEFDGGEPGEDAPATDFRKEAKEAAFHAQKLLEWYQQQPNAICVTTMLLRKLRSEASKVSETTVKQTKVTDFFEPQ